MNRITIILLLLIWSRISLSQNERAGIIQVITDLTLKHTAVRDYSVFLVYDSSIKDSVAISRSSPRSLALQKNKVYTMYYKKKDAPGKYVIIDTSVPEKVSLRKFKVRIKVELDPVCSRQKENMDDFPSAIIKYSPKTKNFEYIKNYHKQIHR